MDIVIEAGHAPFQPLQAFARERFEDGPVGRARTMEFCLRAIDMCDEFWMFGVSVGTLAELTHALAHKKPIKLLVDRFDPEWKSAYEKLRGEFGNPLEKVHSGIS